jgi:ribonuclease Z
MGAVRFIYGKLPYELTIEELEPAQTVPGEGYVVAPFPVRHRGAAFGYALVEDDRPGHLDAELAQRLGVTPGPDLGRLQRGETVGDVRPEQVVGPARAGRKIVLSGDTCPCETLALAADQATVLVHEATFADDELDRARVTQHSTASQAAELARAANVHMLALTHISTRYAGKELRAQARTLFAATEAPHDFDTIEVPFPERGEPLLVRWRPNARRPPAESEVPPEAAAAPTAAPEVVAQR